MIYEIRDGKKLIGMWRGSSHSPEHLCGKGIIIPYKSKRGISSFLVPFGYERNSKTKAIKTYLQAPNLSEKKLELLLTFPYVESFLQL
jgi:hypothetical protein